VDAQLRALIDLQVVDSRIAGLEAQVAKIPLGTVMSRLARARKRLERILTRHDDKETCQEIGVEAL